MSVLIVWYMVCPQTPVKYTMTFPVWVSSLCDIWCVHKRLSSVQWHFLCGCLHFVIYGVFTNACQVSFPMWVSSLCVQIMPVKSDSVISCVEINDLVCMWAVNKWPETVSICKAVSNWLISSHFKGPLLLVKKEKLYIPILFAS